MKQYADIYLLQSHSTCFGCHSTHHQEWIGRTGKEDDVLMRWPPRSPDLTQCDFFFWKFVKETVFVPPLSANLQIFATVSPLLWLWSTVIC